MILRSIFLDPPQSAHSGAFRYGFLALICLLLAFNLYNFATRSPGYSGDPYGGLIIAIMLLLNHVAFQFHLPPRVTVVARILSIAWLAFGLVYICYLSRVLFPLRWLLAGDYSMLHPIHLTKAEAVPTAVVRSRVEPRELSKFVPTACGEVWSFIRAAGLPGGRHVALYLKNHQVEVGAEVAEPFVGTDRIHCSQLPAGRVATSTHFGPYDGLGETHGAVGRWCAENGHPLAGICWEIYGHWEESWNADPSQIRTEVFHLLQDPAV